MQGICKGGIRAKESRLADFWERGCTKCGRLDFILVKKMGIKSGFTFWNLVFLLLVSCVKGRVVLEGLVFQGPLLAGWVMGVLALSGALAEGASRCDRRNDRDRGGKKELIQSSLRRWQIHLLASLGVQCSG